MCIRDSKYAVNDDFALFGSAGPYIAVGLFGKAKAKVDGDLVDLVEFGGNSASEDIFGDDGFKRFDFGLGLKAGVEFLSLIHIDVYKRQRRYLVLVFVVN